MSIPSELLTTSLDSFRPFGSASPVLVGTPCRLIPDVSCGRGSGLSGVLAWSHYADMQPETDILDGLTRSLGANNLLYADGDEVVIPSGTPTARYVVVMVSIVNQGSPDEFKRVFLLRDSLV